MEVVALDHLYISVADFARSEAFYDRLMAYLGFRKGDKLVGGEPHAHYFNRVLQYSIRPARGGRVGHDPYTPGLHHVCFQVSDRAAVDEVHATLRSWGIEATAPRVYPEYNDDYYASFFPDPDGLRLEVVARSRYRQETAERWHEMRVFLNPLAELRARDPVR
jgi:catechol 2,3-dioxygenase-like lactoylglutathione lyase family enzyme